MNFKMKRTNILALLFILLLTSSCSPRPEPKSFQDCVNMNLPIMRTDPARCVSRNGNIFVRGATEIQER
jgi:hypothetical protein